MYVMDNLYGTALSGISENFLFLEQTNLIKLQFIQHQELCFYLIREIARFLCAIIMSFFILARVERTKLSGYCW
jgi:hypothetical protein